MAGNGSPRRIPEKTYKPVEKELHHEYVKPINQSTRTPTPEVTELGSIPTRSQDTIKIPDKQDINKWEQIFQYSTLFYGIRMDTKEPESADHCLLELQKSEDIYINIKRINESNTRTYTKDKEMQSSFVSSNYFDGGLENTCPSIGIGVNTDYLKSKATTNIERTVYITNCRNYPRVVLSIDLSFLQLTSKFLEEIDDVLSIESLDTLEDILDKQISKLKEVYKRYGHVYPSRVVLGGHLYRTETQIVKNKAEENKERRNFQTSFNTSILETADVHIDKQSETKLQTNSSEQTSDVVWKVVGGNTTISGDEETWAKTVNDPLSWGIIERDNYKPIIILLDKKRKEKIEEIENYSKKKTIFGHIYFKWKQEAITMAYASTTELLNTSFVPSGICIDDQTIYFTDTKYSHVLERNFKSLFKITSCVGGQFRRGKAIDRLNKPTDVIIDKEHRCFYIADRGNRRVLQWPYQNETTQGKIIIENIDCYGLTMDKNGYLYVSDSEMNAVKRWRRSETDLKIVAGGNGAGDELNQLSFPTYIFAHGDYLYISDTNNHRIMKWLIGEEDGSIVAGAHGKIYVADHNNHRVVRWCEGDKEGRIVVGGNGRGEQPNQLSGPKGLSFDNKGNLYVVDEGNVRIQKFEVDSK